jgi:hypothetical protein
MTMHFEGGKKTPNASMPSSPLIGAQSIAASGSSWPPKWASLMLPQPQKVLIHRPGSSVLAAAIARAM